jgi:hypothetical protein
MTEGTGYDGASLTEEIRLLVELVVEHAAPWLDGLVSAGHGPEQAEEHTTATPSGNCGWCPLCAIVNVVHGERPEFAARLLEQAAQLVALLRAVLADRWEPQDGVHMPGFHPAPARQATVPPQSGPTQTASAHSAAWPSSRQDELSAGRVQHIAVRKSAQWQPDREN